MSLAPYFEIRQYIEILDFLLNKGETHYSEIAQEKRYFFDKLDSNLKGLAFHGLIVYSEKGMAHIPKENVELISGLVTLSRKTEEEHLKKAADDAERESLDRAAFGKKNDFEVKVKLP